MNKTKMMKSMEIMPCLQNKNQILIIGDEQSKRTIYFSKASRSLGYDLKCVDWNMIEEIDLSSFSLVKIDPPIHIGTKIEELERFRMWYHQILVKLDRQKARWSNSPCSIYKTLDKLLCKQYLEDKAIEITPRLEIEVNTYEALVDQLVEEDIRNIFIKPRYGSGAAGIVAYRYNPKIRRSIIYTSLKIGDGGKLYNTKNISKLTQHGEIKEILNNLLAQPVIIEQWVQKAQYKGLSYDLRVVYQYGKIDYIIARGSKNPITNLHLNNHAIPIQELNLTIKQMQIIEDLCRSVVSCFDGLNIAGIDILMTPSGKFKVIEVNGQGDLIYNDIFSKNYIYTRQIIEGVKRYGE
ncbi:STM4014 family protein [Tissierellaceae bacterium HCP3S3_D8]